MTYLVRFDLDTYFVRRLRKGSCKHKYSLSYWFVKRPSLTWQDLCFFVSVGS